MNVEKGRDTIVSINSMGGSIALSYSAENAPGLHDGLNIIVMSLIGVVLGNIIK